MTITLPPETEALLHQTAQREGRNPDTFAVSLLAEALETHMARFAEDAAAIQEGLDALAEGRVRPVQDYIAEQRARHGYPETWPASAVEQP